MVGDYYLPRWETFLKYLLNVSPSTYSDAEARTRVAGVESGFQVAGSGLGVREVGGDVRSVVESGVVPALKELGLM